MSEKRNNKGSENRGTNIPQPKKVPNVPERRPSTPVKKPANNNQA